MFTRDDLDPRDVMSTQEWMTEKDIAFNAHDCGSVEGQACSVCADWYAELEVMGHENDPVGLY